MNAPADLPALTAELVPLDVICTSDTHIQQLRRARFSAEKILELAANIQRVGVLEPIILRPFPTTRDYVKGKAGVVPKYEIVAGERRFLAADRAGLAHVPSVIRELDDGDVLVVQISENTQRDDYTPLEESAGYVDLKALKRWDTQEVADHIGKSKSYVYARMKLNDLIDECRVALTEGEIDYSKALLLARFGPKLQKKALKQVRGDYVTYKNAFVTLRRALMAEIAEAPFRLDDERRSILVGANTYAFDCGPCTTCPHNSANDPELAREISGDAHVCTNRPCFEAKSAAYWAEQRHEAEKSGQQILGHEAIPNEYQGYNADYVRLDTELYPATSDESDDEAGVKTARELLGDDVVTVLAQGKDGQLIKLVPMKIAKPLLKKRGVELDQVDDVTSGHGSEEELAKRRAENEREKERRAVEHEHRKRLFIAIAAKFKGGLKRPDFERLADVLINQYGYSAAIDTIYPRGKTIIGSKLKDDELARLIALHIVSDEVDTPHAKPSGLLELAQRFKIDVKALRATVVKDLKPTAAPKDGDDEPATPKKKTAKK